MSRALCTTLGFGLLGGILVGCQSPASARSSAPVSAPATVTRHAEPETQAPFTTFFAEEERVAAQVAAQALDLAHTVIAAHARLHNGEDGPELSWFPALGQVAAHERIVVYGEPRVDRAAYRTGEVRTPFRVIIAVPCRIWSRSGEGIAVVGDPFAADVQRHDSSGMTRVLPISTASSDVQRLAPAQQLAALAARASCVAATGREESVAVPLTFVLERESGTVVLDTGAPAAPVAIP